MGKNKLQRFKEVKAFENVLELTEFQDDDSVKPKGRWHSDIFRNDHPITLELACGKGHYTLELARRNPQKNYVGVDIKGARIWKGAKRALGEKLHNVRFLRIYIDHLYEYFAPSEVAEIWITFPDPYPKFSDRNKRLSAAKFLAIYQQVLDPNGMIHFKTDNTKLFDYTLETIEKHHCKIQEIVTDIYADRPDSEILTIKTDYEKRHLSKGKKIKYVCFSLPSDKKLQE